MAAPNLALGDILRIRATASVNGQTAIWGCDERVSSVVGASVSIQQAADAVAAIFDAEIPATVADPVLVGSPIVELVSPLTGVVLQSALGNTAGPAGSGGANLVPMQAAAIVQKKTGLAGPRMRGRMYWPFLPAGAITSGGRLSAAFQLVLAAAVGNMFAAQTFTVGAASASVAPIVLHRYIAPAIPTYQDITSFAFTYKIGTQRRRGDYGKPNPPI